jgi:hypothetical protein
MGGAIISESGGGIIPLQGGGIIPELGGGFLRNQQLAGGRKELGRPSGTVRRNADRLARLGGHRGAQHVERVRVELAPGQMGFFGISAMMVSLTCPEAQ